MTQVLSLVNSFNAFISGCKLDGTWDSIKASCVMAGWSNLSGALTPLAGVAPSGFNLASGEYSRASGLKGDGVSMYLNSNRNNNADPQNSNHQCVYASQNDGTAGLAEVLICAGGTSIGATQIGLSVTSPNVFVRSRSETAAFAFSGGDGIGLFGLSRANSPEYTYRLIGANTTVAQASQSPVDSPILVFARNNDTSGNVTPSVQSNARLSFYSIGESLDLALLDNRVTVLMSGIQNAIP